MRVHIIAKMNLLHLPEDVLNKILSYLSYDEISRLRLICRRFDSLAKLILNRGFHKVERYHAQCLKHVKSQLPRRESERRKHPLARHCDILTAVETRLSLLGMTFMKFMELKLCCFIPGKVLDEIYKVLRYVTVETTPVRAHEVLQELRDLSSMAMEHFDEKISPAFRKRKETGPKIVTGINIYAPSMSHHSKSASRHGGSEHKSSRKWKEEVKTMALKQNANRKEINSLKLKVMEMSKSQTELEKKVCELQNLLVTHVEKLKEQDLKLGVVQHIVRLPSTRSVSASTTTSDVSSTLSVTDDKDMQPLFKKRQIVHRVSDRCRKRTKKD